MALLEEEVDINQLTEYFSYEHFYVIYCKFWELDTDHDLYIDPKDLARHNDHGMANQATWFSLKGACSEVPCASIHNICSRAFLNAVKLCCRLRF